MSTRIHTTGSHARFMRAVNEEFGKFERSEWEFRKKDREERAKRLRMPIEKYDTHDRTVKRTINPNL